MYSERVLLIHNQSDTKVFPILTDILDPHFKVDRATYSSSRHNDVGEFVRHLDKTIKQNNPDLVVLIASDGSLSHRAHVLKSINETAGEIPLMLALEPCQSDEVIELLQLGASDFIVSPFTPQEVLTRAWRLLRILEPQAKSVSNGARPGFNKIIGESAAFLVQLRRIPIIAKCEANVLIGGETGTGKELYARAIHYSSPRAGKPFMPVNCGAIPIELVENELFGHQRGAFTSASTLQPGLIEEANGGTLFLDEIDCLPLSAQVKLLRFLQEKEYRPLGSSKVRRADVRIIAASNLNLEEAVGNGKVRQDLFYRLNIISLLLPPLRDRREDIGLLAGHFLKKYSAEFDKDVEALSDEALNVLMVHSWPGNVRELEHVIERAIVMCEGSTLQVGDIILSSTDTQAPQQSLQEAKAQEIARFERNYIQGLLSACKGNITRAAQVARKNRRAFWQLIQKYEIDVAKFKTAR
jgi:DNA-binding NtrC family response regulator